MVGTDHLHIVEIVQQLAAAGARIAAICATEDRIGPWLASRHPDAAVVAEPDDAFTRAHVLATAIVPADRPALAIRAMHAGLDVVADKPGATTVADLDALITAHRTTGRRYTVVFSERVASAAMRAAEEIVTSGRIGTVVHTVGLGPHTLGLEHRPPWFFDRDRYGGILVDIGAHQADQFLTFTGAPTGDVVAASVRTLASHPGVDVLGEVLWTTTDATGYARVDYLTAAGLGAWGDVRLTVVGTAGSIEVRALDQTLTVVDAQRTEVIPCGDRPARWGAAALEGTLVTQDHVWASTRLALAAQERARAPGNTGVAIPLD